MTDNKRKKTTAEQRLRMLQFMEEHPDLAQNRVQGLDAKKRATVLWDQLTSHLNSCGNGATKSTDKWMKSWRDWRVDTKAKAAKIKNYQRGTGGGGPSPVPLLEIEERLIALMGIESVEGHTNIIDPAEPQNWTRPSILQHQDNPPPSQCLPLSTCSSKISLIKNFETYPRSSLSISLSSTNDEDNPPPSQCLPLSTCSSKPRIKSIETYPRSLSLQETTSLSSSSPLTTPTSSSPIYLRSSTEQHGGILLPSEFYENSEEVLSKDVPTKRRKKQSSTEMHDIDVQILHEMKAQTISLQKLTDAVIDIAESIKYFVQDTTVVQSSNTEEMMNEENFED